jgi:transposase
LDPFPQDRHSNTTSLTAWSARITVPDGSLTVDGHPAHRATAVKQYIASTEGRLKLFRLPGYSPVLNPDEWV